MGLLPDTQICGLRMRRECRERFPRQPPRISDPDMHHGTWFPLKSVAGKTFPTFPAHAQLTILRIWQEAHGQSYPGSKL